MRAALVVSLVLALAGCHRDASAPEAKTPEKKAGPEPAKVVVTKDRTDLVFTYVDPTGQFHDATSISDVPETARAQVLVRDLSKTPDELHSADFLYVADLREAGPDGHYACGAVSRFGFEKQGLKEAAHEAAKGAEEKGEALVTVYSASWCGVCKSAKSWLKSRGIPYAERDVENDPGAGDELAAKAQKAGIRPNGVPVIDVAGELMVGFDAQALQRLLEKKGLAKTL